MKKIAIVIFLASTSAFAGEYQQCSSNAAELGEMIFITKKTNKDGSWPAAIDNNSRAGIHGSVMVDDNSVSFQSRDFWGDVYQDIKVTLPRNTFLDFPEFHRRFLVSVL